MRIALCGVKNAGKDYVADKLKLHFNNNAEILSFSDNLKMICQTLFPFMEKDYSSKEKEIPLNIEYDGAKIIHSPRQIWNTVGMMKNIDPRIFIRPLERKLMSSDEYDNIIIKDVRTFEEYKFIRKFNFTLISIKRDVNIQYDEYDYSVDRTLAPLSDFIYHNEDGDKNFQSLLNHIKSYKGAKND